MGSGGKVSEMATLDAQGAILPKPQWVGISHGYAGHVMDHASGSSHQRLRTYAPTLGRYLQPDPLEYVDGMNRYAYVFNQPHTYRDEMGLLKACQANHIMRKRGFNVKLWKFEFEFDIRSSIKIQNCYTKCDVGSVCKPLGGSGSNWSYSSAVQGTARVKIPFSIGPIPPGVMRLTGSGSYAGLTKASVNTCTGVKESQMCHQWGGTAGVEGSVEVPFFKVTLRGEGYLYKSDCYPGGSSSCKGVFAYIETCRNRHKEPKKFGPAKVTTYSKGCWRSVLIDLKWGDCTKH
jgi:RHS repeat-associated protein